jgi:hypothetical protein
MNCDRDRIFFVRGAKEQIKILLLHCDVLYIACRHKKDLGIFPWHIITSAKSG